MIEIPDTTLTWDTDFPLNCVVMLNGLPAIQRDWCMEFVDARKNNGRYQLRVRGEAEWLDLGDAAQLFNPKRTQIAICQQIDAVIQLPNRKSDYEWTDLVTYIVEACSTLIVEEMEGEL